TLTNTATRVSVSMMSSSTGAYAFAGVLPGTYTITWTAASGDTTEAPAASQLPTRATATAGTISNIVVASTNLTINLPEVTKPVVNQTGTISGTVKYEQQGGQTASEVLEPGVTVDLVSNGVIVAHTVTDVNGAYSFGSLPLGAYTVQLAPNALDMTTFPSTVRTGNLPVPAQTDTLTATATTATANFVILYPPGA